MPSLADFHGERAARLLLVLFAFSLAFMQPPLRLLGFSAVPGDFVFIALAAIWASLLVQRRTRLVVDRGYYFIGAYYLALLASAAARDAPLASSAKLVTQLYLVSIPIVVCSLIRDETGLRHAVRWWLTGTAVVAGVAIASLSLFVINPGHPLLEFSLFHFGTLPPGNYPRLRLTFLNANMACNYLTMSLMLLLAADRLTWIRRSSFLLLLIGLLVAAASTISPGLGGIALAGSLWLWLVLQDRRPRIGLTFLTSGIVCALIFVGAMMVTPILHPTAPFLIHIPGLESPLAPAGRLMTWIEAAKNFAKEPIFGRGIGSHAILVSYQSPSGVLQQLTDAHNIFLSVAVQCGLLGLAALLALIGHIVRRTGPLLLPRSSAGVMRLAIGLGLLNGLVYQGIGGSFEDARHIWFALGLLLASSQVERSLVRPTSR